LGHLNIFFVAKLMPDSGSRFGGSAHGRAGVALEHNHINPVLSQMKGAACSNDAGTDNNYVHGSNYNSLGRLMTFSCKQRTYFLFALRVRMT